MVDYKMPPMKSNIQDVIAMKYKIGDHVRSQSGLTYIIIAAHALDMCGAVAYSVRRLRGGQIWGPTRKIAESALYPETSTFVYDEDKMFPFATSRHTTTE